MECLKTVSSKQPDENRDKIAHNRSQNINGIVSFTFGVNLGHRIFTYTDKLSKTIQAKKMSACNSKMLAELTIQDFQNMRKEYLFNSF